MIGKFTKPLSVALFLGLFSLSAAFSQVNISNYVFSTGTDASLVRSYGSLVDDISLSTGSYTHFGGPSNTSYTTTLQNIGFDFWMYGNRNTTFGATSHGMVGINQIAFYTYTFLQLNARMLAPFLASSNAMMGTSDGGSVRSKVIGTAPSRVLVIQFRNMAINSTVQDDSNLFQVRLYERTGMIEYVYGTMRVDYAPTAVNFNVGFQCSNTVYQNVNLSSMTASTSSAASNSYSSTGYITNMHGSSDGNRRYIRWMPTPPNDPTNISTSNITATSVTLNWTDASNETGYALYRSTDGVNYSWVTNLAANTTITTQAGLTANTTYYWRLYSYREALGLNPLDISATTNAPANIISVTSGNWNAGTTWSGGTVPTASDIVEISPGDSVIANVSTTISGLNVKGKLYFNPAATAVTLTVNGSVGVESTGVVNAGVGTATHILNIGGNTNAGNYNGNLVCDGVFDFNTATSISTVGFYGANSAAISGTGNIDLGNLTVNKGTSSATQLNVNTTFTMALPTTTGRLALTNGTLKINSALSVSPFISSQSWAAGTTARLWLNNSGITLSTVGATANPTGYIYFPQGSELRMDGGVFNMGAGCTACTPTSANTFYLYGTLNFNAGRINLNGSMQVLSNAATVLNLNGGDINVYGQGTGFAVPTGTVIVNIGQLTTLNWSSGNITIADPHASTGTGNSYSFSMTAGGSKNITGGKLVIGDGMSGLSTGTTINGLTGFAINSTVPLYQLELNNRYDLSQSRYCRIVGSLTVTNNVNLRGNSYLFTGNGNPVTAGTLVVQGGFTNNGIISGVVPGTAVAPVGTISFEGSAAQTFGGTGTTQNAAVLQNNSANTLTFTNTNLWSFARVNLLQGSIMASASTLEIGNSSTAPTVQIGGISESTAAGTFTALPSFNTTAGPINYVYAANSSSTNNMGSFNEMGTGTINIGSLTISDANGVRANGRDLNVLNLSMSGGDLTLNANNLTIGTGTTTPGTLSKTSGNIVFTTGTLTRWYNNTAIPSFGNAYGLPYTIAGTNLNRSLQIAASALFSSGGTLSVKHSYTNGYTDISPSYSDAGVTVNRRSNSYWVISSGNGLNLGTATLGVKLFGQGIGSLNTVADLRLAKSSSIAAGTNVNGTGDVNTPEINRNFTQATLSALNDTFYVGVDQNVNQLSPTFIAIQNGDWNNPNTWEIGAVPGAINLVIIPSGVTVTIPGATGQSFSCDSLAVLAGGTLVASNSNNNGLTINRNLYLGGTLTAGGTTITIVGRANNGIFIDNTGNLTVSGSMLNIGPSGGGNRFMNVSGAFVINNSASIVNLNGYFTLNTSGSFTQSDGAFSLDPNSGTAATSATSGNHTMSLNSNSISCSGGNLIFVDPPHQSISAGSTHTLRVNAVGSLNEFTGTHTVVIGDGSSTETGNANGFSIDTKRNGVVPLNNVLVNSGNPIGRWLSPSFSGGSFGLHINGTLTINNSSELRHTTTNELAISGNLINNGTFTASASFTFGGIGYNTTTAQAVSGNGFFRNATSAPTASLASVVVNNPGGVSFNTSGYNFTISNGLTLTSGVVTTNNNKISVLQGATYSRSNGFIDGTLVRYMNTGSNVSMVYDLGSSTDYMPVTVSFPSVTTAGLFEVSASSGDHPQIASSCFDPTKTLNRNFATANNGVAPLAYGLTFAFTSSYVDVSTSPSSFKVQLYNGSTWNNTTLVSAGTSSTQISGLSSVGGFQVGEYTSVTPTISISASATTVCQTETVTFNAFATSGGPSPSYQWKKNGSNVGTNSDTYVASGLANNDVITCVLTSNSPCVTTATANSNSIVMDVSPMTVKGAVSSNATICSGTSVGTLTLSGHTGDVQYWESSVAPFTSWNGIVNTSTTLSVGSISQTTQYRAVVQSGVCEPDNSDAAVITVNPTSVGGTISGNNAICAGSSPGVLTLSGQTGNIVRWESAVAPFSSWNSITNTATTYSPGILAVTTRFRAVIQSGVCGAVNSTEFTVTVTPGAVGGSVNGGTTICAGTPAGTLTLSGHTGSVQNWESSVSPFTSWTTISNTGTTYSPGNLSETTQFRAVVQSGSCGSAVSNSTTVTVTPAAIGGTVSGPSGICSGSNPGALTLSGHTGTIVQWESSVSPFTTWTTISNTSTSHSPGALTQTTQFRAVVQSGSCGSTTSSILTISVTSTVVGGTVTGTSNVCSGTSPGVLVLSGFTGTVTSWASATAPYTSWTTISNTSSTYTPGNLTVPTAFKALVTSGSCGSAVSDSLIIGISTASVGGSVSGSTSVCSGSTSGTLSLTGQTGSVQRWESSVSPFTSWTTISNTSTSYTSGALTQTMQFRAVVKSGSCLEAASTPATISVTTGGQWTGAVSSDWNNASNWCGGVPTASTNVVINSGTPNSPLINTTAVVNNILINTGATLMFTGSGNSLDVRGSLNISGTFNTNNGTVIFGGSASQVIPGRTYNSVTVAGGSTKILGGNVTVTGTLTLTNGKVVLGSSDLVISGAGSISGGSSSSYIVTDNTGHLIQQNLGSGGRTGTILFPVGASLTDYTPVSLQNSGTADVFNVKVITGAYPGYSGETPSGTAYTSNVVNATWFVNEVVTGGSNATLTFQWNGGNELGGFDRNNCYVAGYLGTDWMKGAFSSASGSDPYTLTVSGLNAFAPFGVGSNGTLPVELITFRGEKQGENVLLSWATAHELNNALFEVERSLDGTEFVKIGERMGAGNSMALINYNFEDVAAFKKASVFYYRLKQVDFDGKFSYSNTIVVQEGIRNLADSKVVPNPFAGGASVYFETSAATEANISVINVLGAVVYSSPVNATKGMNEFVLDAGMGLKSGIYFIKIEAAGRSEMIKVVKE